MTQAQPVAPLTIIAIFAGIIEASALATLPFLSESSQKLYTWFLVGFPFFLTALFFLTLNFNYKSFYSPSSDRAANGTTLAENSVATPAMADGAREAVQGEPVTFMFSGPDANRMMEQQLLSALAQPPLPARTWRFCNLDRRQCAQLSISALDGHVVNDEH
ncbi:MULTISPECIES: hypothetical protein [Pseudomonas]|jgi:hypothetical protein|uniref:Uncharacterized protein n=3 Tax=Pseudomonas TaxID=286 RepID=A0A1L7NIM2_PSEPU|nr:MULTISPECIES: hypothetical protein [Pseudomonas]ERT17277.1 hypothetical protein O162_18520 [Pseudomonas putida SJ3]PNB62783.1 hypothetical protein C1X73_00320 [Pseudomonas sp. FW305-130]AGN80270.1 hypothetical protein L483_26015 [Pseudomonas putida H8234]EKT4449692.1 hypothetical protein [Pseudomonas putida]EKT4559289.1 hypothetical protein [Pseudomonas putida]